MTSRFYCAAMLVCALAASAFARQAMAAKSTEARIDVPVRSAVLTDIAVGQATLVNYDHDWRYRWHGGQWWYWRPNNSWCYWSGGAWHDYHPGYSHGQRYYSYYPYGYGYGYGYGHYGHGHYGHGHYGHGHYGHGGHGGHGHGGHGHGGHGHH